MKLFSERMGIKPIRDTIQIDSIDSELRNGLWNGLKIYYWDAFIGSYISTHKELDILFKRLWHTFFKRPLDTLDDSFATTYKEIRSHFFTCKWNEVYDFIQFVANNYPGQEHNQSFMTFCNSVLERELSGYRFVGGIITPLTSKEQIAEIEKALHISGPMEGVNTHLKTAIHFLSDRKSPDYRNSIKESISAVEALCTLITKSKKANIDQALKELEGKVDLHPALRAAFIKLYAYTSDAEGIRHALLDEARLGFEDANFMLISCSAFVNYLIGKTSKAGMKI